MKALKRQNRAAWEIDVFDKLYKSGALGAKSVNYIARRNVKLSFGAQPTGAKWTLKGMLLGPPEVIVNSKQTQGVKSAKDNWSLSVIAHEIKHYEQGLLVALSVYGELEAWLLQMRILRDLGSPPKHPALKAIEKLKLSHDPKILREAARLMKEYSPEYRVDLLPLNPITYFGKK